MDSCDELEDHLLSVIQKSVEQRITFKEISGQESSAKINRQDQAIQQLVILRERNRKNRMRELEENRDRRGGNAAGAATEEKENSSPSRRLDRNCEMRSSVKSALKKLGNLYSGGNISSPIHRTEAEFSVEPDDDYPAGAVAVSPTRAVVRPGVSRPEARSARLAALANTINQWEDDLSHPVIVKHEPERLDRFGNVVGKKSARSGGKIYEGALPKPSSTANSKAAAGNVTKRGLPLASVISPQKKATSGPGRNVVWDNAMIASLEAQGFARCESRQHLIYDYADERRTSPVQCLSPSRHNIGQGRAMRLDEVEDIPSRAEPYGGGDEDEPDRRRKRAPERDVVERSPAGRALHDAVLPPATSSPFAKRLPDGIEAASTPPRKILSPRRDTVNSNGSGGSPRKATAVMEMAAAIEEGSRSPTKFGHREAASGDGLIRKDPAELSLAERKALFEKNGGGAVLPKAPFAMPVPRSALKSATAKPPINGGALKHPTRGPYRTELPGKAPEMTVGNKSAGLSARLAMFERQRSDEAMEQDDEEEMEARDPVREEIAERQREVEMLRNRHRARIMESEMRLKSDKDEEVNRPLPQKATHSPRSPAPLLGGAPTPPPPPPPAAAPTPPPPPPPMPSKMLHDPTRDTEVFLSPRRSLPPSERYPDVKRIRVSPPKPGRLYPSISDIETETESELPESDRQPSSEESSFEDDSGSVSSLGGRIVKFASTTSIIPNHSTLKRSSESTNSSNSSTTVGSSDESKVLQEIDDFLDEALREPSPKRSRDSSFDELVERTMVSYPSGSCQSTSFEYSSSAVHRSDDSESNTKSHPTEHRREDVEMRSTSHEDQDTQPVQLVHTISLYRKQQQNSGGKPVAATIKREEFLEPKRVVSHSSRTTSEREDEEDMVEKKIQDILLEVSRQQTVIAQASQALNLCCSTVEFSGSSEQVEGERLLLIATLCRQACLHELQRLRVEKRLRPGGGPIHAEKGNVTIEQFMLPVKMDAIHQAAREEKCQHVVCMVRCGGSVLATEMLAAVPKNLTSDGKLRFDKRLSLDGVYGDFTATVEVYTMAARSKELLPHDIKYHITPSASAKKDKLRLTPKKGSKGDTKFLRSAVESPGGPHAVRSPAFTLAGFIVFSLRELSRTHFILNKVPYGSVVDGTIDMKISCDMSVNSEHRGFLTMFEDVSGFGAWNRRWCLLKGDCISYWKYPEDEENKIALDTIDLSQCATKEVGLVSRDMCARPNTFLLEIIRPSRPSDVETLVVKPLGDTTVIRHLLSADTKEDRLEWCDQINRMLGLLRAWGKHPPQHQQSKRRHQ